MSTHLSDLAIDRLARANRDTEDAVPRHIPDHLDTCGDCRARYAELLAQMRQPASPLPAFLAEMPTQDNVVSIGARRPRRWLAPALTTLAAAALMLVAMRTPEVATERAKGAVGRLEVHVQHPGEVGARPLGDAAVHPGDVLQWVVTLREPRWVAIVGRDSAGVTGSYFPRDTDAGEVAAGEAIRLDASLTLDATLGTESLTVLFCRAPITAEVAAAAGVGSDCEVQRVELRKTVRP